VNALAAETSPYLLQHKDNPVDWLPWGPEAFARARAEGRPILLSVGYAACHWCHVMAHESFEDTAIARLMNERFVNVKVDREERPDIDALYQNALALMGEHGGWPLTMFLAPDGAPFFGGTYFPPVARYGRPGFTEVLRAVAEVYRTRPAEVEGNAAVLRGALRRLATPQGFGGALSLADLDRGAAQAVALVDPAEGGTAGAPKFPQPTFFRFLWHAAFRTGDAACRRAVLLTLERMSQGGIYDHLGGGFARYSTDTRWLVPHFEKMLYDNALLVELLTLAWQGTAAPLFAARVEETVGWLLREMTVPLDPARPDGPFAFAGTLDADSEDVEGRFYVWTEAEIDRLLGVEAAAFKAVYDVTAEGNWEGLTILNRRRDAGPADEALLDRCRRVLFAARRARVPPGRDDKVLADWNGLAVAALVAAANAFRRRDWLEAARTAFAFVADHMTVDGRLRHAWRAGRARHPATLDDLAAMARAALALHEATGEAAYLARAETWAAEADRRHRDGAGGGYFLSADDTADVLARTKVYFDNATPSGNGLMAEVLARLFHLTGRTEYRERAAATVAAFAPANPEHLTHMGTLAIAFELLARPVRIAVAGPAAAPETEALLAEALAAGVPGKVVVREGAPAAAPAVAHVCVGATCGPPLADPSALREALARL
jgi:uncharacterized protein YyaL (SSP411 family)